MIALAIQYLVATSCLLLVVSLPLGKSATGSTLRRIAAALFLLAFLPSLFFGVISETPSGHATQGSGGGLGCSISAMLGLVILSLVAYAILEIRKRIGRTSKDAWSEYINLRSTGKTSVRSQKPQRRRGASPLLDEDE